MKELLLTYDIGTTGAKAVLFKKDASMVGSRYKKYSTYYPRAGWVEQSPNEWWEAVIGATKELIQETGVDPNDIAAISFSGQMMGQVPVDRNGNLLQDRVPIWADARASEQVDRVFEVLGGYENFYDITLQGHNPMLYALFRVMWYRDNMPSMFKQVYKFLHSKEYIAMKMTGSYATDYTDQALGCTLDMNKRTWSKEMFAAADLSVDLFPELKESIDVMGYMTKEVAEQLDLVEGIPVAVGAGDGPCAAAGAGALAPGDAYFYIGSASWGGTIETKPIGDFDTKVIVHNHLVPGLYHSQYVMYTGAIAQQWAIETLFADTPADIDAYKLASDLAHQIPIAEDTAVFLPYMRPGGAPYNNMSARGVFTGLGLNHKREHLFRAVLEGVSMNIKLLLDRFEKFRRQKLPELTVIGGGSRNPYWMHLLADISGRRIINVNLKQEANCFAAAQCAGVGVGVYSGFEEIRSLFKAEDEFLADPAVRDFYQRKYDIFLEAYQGMLKTYDKIANLEQYAQ
ncbi:MAG: FGGY family carbohydrate kinase [Chloroflexota bacterium]|jgi:xylulokinase